MSKVRGRLQAAFFLSQEVITVKQFLIMKIVEGLNQMAGMIALPGFYTLEAAQRFVSEALTNEPESRYLIQEVGTA